MKGGRPPIVYCVFNAVGSGNPSQSDIRYFNLLKAWNRQNHGGPAFVDSHGLRFPSGARGRRERLRAELEARLAASDVVLALFTRRSSRPGSWLTWELRRAVERYGLPVLCVYPEGMPDEGGPVAGFPAELGERLRGALVEHLPFRRIPLFAALSRWRGRSRAGEALYRRR